MPPLKPVITLKKLCTSTVAEHLFNVFLSWSRSQDLTKLASNVAQRETVGSTMDYSDCYLIENEMDSECFLDLLTNGKSGVGDYRYLGESENDNTERSLYIPSLFDVPNEHKTVGDLSLMLACKVRKFLSGCLIPSLFEVILATLINMVAQELDISRSSRNISIQEKDLQFINSLSFLLKVSLSALLIKGVESLNLSSVAHCLLRWKSVCTTVLVYMKTNFDLFSYVLDQTLPGLRTLKYIHLPHFVQDNLVRKIGFLCPNLEILILRCCSDISKPSTSSCRNKWSEEESVVTDLDALFGYGITFKYPDNVEFKLRGCKKLVSLALPWGLCVQDLDESVFRMLLFMCDLKHYVGPPVRPLYQLVKHFHNCSPHVSNLNKILREEYQVSIVLSHDCTDGRSLTLSDTERDSVEDLLKLGLYPKVKDLLITVPDDNIELDFLEMFPDPQTIMISAGDEIPTKYLKNLTSLSLTFVDMKELLSVLCRSCPSLEILIISFPILDLSVCDVKSEQITLPLLRTLGLIHGEGSSLPTILSCCPALSCFEFSTSKAYSEVDNIWEQNVDGLNTATFHKTLPYLSKLRKFIYSVLFIGRVNCPRTLTINSLKALISMCPDLKYVGYLKAWDIRREEFVALKQEIKMNNWDLELAW